MICRQEGCERVDARVPEEATHLLVVTGPPDAAQLNRPDEVCVSCAIKLTEAWIGYGWSVVAARLREDNHGGGSR